MRVSIVVALVAMSSLPALANCLPPWQTQFSCSIPEQGARAEFCHIANPQDHPEKKEAYYSYAVGTNPAELYFETDSTWFSTKDTQIDHPTDLVSAIGYAKNNWIYAFVLTEDNREPDGVRDAEVRVYSSIDSFTSATKDTEVARLYCEPSSILVDIPTVRP